MENKENGFNLIWILVIVVITSVISAITTGVIMYNNNKIARNVSLSDLSNDEELNKFLQVYANITSEYYQNVDKKELLSKAISAMMGYLGDDYTTYLNDEESSDLADKLSGEYNGIGISINNETKTIMKVYEDTPASKAGLQEGDIIIGFNNEDLTNISADDTVNMIKGADKEFTLKIQRGEEILTINLKNEKIISPSIDYKMLDNTKTGYIYIETFSKTLKTQMEKALKSLEDEGMENLIIDLRDDTGGYLDAAKDVASMFLPKGKTIYKLDYKNKITSYEDKTNEEKKYKVVVLTNKNTASSSEILTAALKESYGATIVGETSFGKGRVQQVLNLEDGSMVKYTSAYWQTPNGTCIDGVGITPDYEVANETITDEEGNITEIVDKQLETARNLLNP